MATQVDELGMVMIEDETPAPVTVPEGEDPWPVLRTMQKFMPGTNRGECEIIDPRKPHEPNAVLGYTILLGHPERTLMPVFDCRARVVEAVELAAWLKARGYEASACQWRKPNAAFLLTPDEGKRRWQLITGEAKLPSLPSTAPDAANIATIAAQANAQYQNALQQAAAGGSLLAGIPGFGLGGLGLGPLKGR